MFAEGGEYKVSGKPAGFVKDSPPIGDKPHSITVRSALGTDSEAHLQADGTVSLEASGRPDVGTRGEPLVQKILTKRLSEEGTIAESLPGAADSRGEDGLLIVGGERRTLQVTAVPSSSAYWGDAARDSATTIVPRQRAIEWIREAVLRKSEVDDRQGRFSP